MKLVIFGATGQTGRLLIARGLSGGHQVTSFARNPTRLDATSGSMRAVQGNVLDPTAVDRAVAGALHEPAGTVLGSLGLSLARAVIPGVYREHRAMLEELRTRDLEWIAVRPVILTNGPKTS